MNILPHHGAALSCGTKWSQRHATGNQPRSPKVQQHVQAEDLFVVGSRGFAGAEEQEISSAAW